ncbi:LOB domain-containing protein 4-like [Malania oleifera]|uniref:LOB domain-containing protein 4-like n=1 Tax=Malania oleifera TaxID=397392 RepID=UPI0025ADB308|nr:LOB domain-containing protein 4-like [Malania oleifera]
MRGETRACAACRFQRRKCTAECLLAPYFPAEDPRRFANAHQLFGIKNITKILLSIPAASRPDAMRSIVYESNARAADPVGGCLRITRDLCARLRATMGELLRVYNQIDHHQETHVVRPLEAALSQTAWPPVIGGCDFYAAMVDNYSVLADDHLRRFNDNFGNGSAELRPFPSALDDGLQVHHQPPLIQNRDCVEVKEELIEFQS